MKQDYKNMMEQLTLSPAARAEIQKGIAEASTAKRFSFRSPWRSIAIAVCLCLLLPVTALGIEYLGKPVALGAQEVSEDQAHYRVVAEVTPRSIDQFSARLQKDLENGTLSNTFSDKETLEQYLGISLSESPALAEAGLVEDLAESFEFGFGLRPQLRLDPSARYILTASDWEGKAVTEDPEVLKVSAHRVFQNTEVYLDAWIILDSVTAQQLEEGILGENFPPVTGVTMQMQYDENGYFVLDENGTPVVEPIEFTGTDYTFVQTEYAMPNGCAATIITSRFNEPDGTQGHREYMGYFIHNGILYTVRPYAIYDPALDYPSADTDARNVLIAALDTFQ